LRRLKLILIASLIALAISALLAVASFMNMLSSEFNVKVKHSKIKIDDSTLAITFTLSSPIEGRYRYMVYCNYSDYPFSHSSDGSIWAGGSFTYTLYVNIEPNGTLAVNVKIWWEDKLIDEVTHYVMAEGG